MIRCEKPRAETIKNTANNLFDDRHSSAGDGAGVRGRRGEVAVAGDRVLRAHRHQGALHRRRRAAYRPRVSIPLLMRLPTSTSKCDPFLVCIWANLCDSVTHETRTQATD